MFEAFSAVLQKKKKKKNWKLNPVNDICQKNYENSHIWTLLLFSFTWMKFYDGKETTWFNLTLEFILITVYLPTFIPEHMIFSSWFNYYFV